MKSYNILVLLLSMSLYSCKKEIVFDSKDIEPKLALQGEFETDSLWKVRLTHSLPVLDPAEISVINNATVTITDMNGSSVTTLTSTGDGYYQSTSGFAPSGGSTYRIDVSAPGYKSISATSFAPQIVTIISVDTTTVNIQNQEFKRFDISFKDPVSENDYYIIRPIELYMNFIYDQFNNIIDTTWEYHSVYAKSNSIYAVNAGDDVVERIFLSDKLMKGNQVHVSFDLRSYSGENKYFGVILYHVTEDYFQFHYTLEKYLDSYYDPFAQPVIVYNNITNGRGVFAGFSSFAILLK